jgi:hypothetical protein
LSTHSAASWQPTEQDLLIQQQVYTEILNEIWEPTERSDQEAAPSARRFREWHNRLLIETSCPVDRPGRFSGSQRTRTTEQKLERLCRRFLKAVTERPLHPRADLVAIMEPVVRFFLSIRRLRPFRGANQCVAELALHAALSFAGCSFPSSPETDRDDKPFKAALRIAERWTPVGRRGSEIPLINLLVQRCRATERQHATEG